MRQRLCLFAMAFGFGLGCAGPKIPPTAPIQGIDQMCCKKGDAKSGRFGGCVIQDRACRDETPLWIRGTISCGPVDEANCLGARCCVFGQRWGTEDASLEWEPPAEAFPEGVGNEPAPGAVLPDGSTNSVPVGGEPKPEPAPQQPDPGDPAEPSDPA